MNWNFELLERTDVVQDKIDDAECRVDFRYDNESGVWLATSEDITGLILESESPEILMKRVVAAAEELIELNHLPKYKTINFSVTG